MDEMSPAAAIAILEDRLKRLELKLEGARISKTRLAQEHQAICKALDALTGRARGGQ